MALASKVHGILRPQNLGWKFFDRDHCAAPQPPPCFEGVLPKQVLGERQIKVEWAPSRDLLLLSLPPLQSSSSHSAGPVHCQDQHAPASYLLDTFSLLPRRSRPPRRPAQRLSLSPSSPPACPSLRVEANRTFSKGSINKVPLP